jgi:hypothetical protein
MPSGNELVGRTDVEQQLVETDVVVADLVADLSDCRLTQLKQQTEGPTDCVPADSGVIKATPSTGDGLNTDDAAAAAAEAGQLSPEQDAAAEQCAQDFVDLYEHVSARHTQAPSLIDCAHDVLPILTPSRSTTMMLLLLHYLRT